MKHIKKLKEGDLVKRDIFDGNTVYDSLELNENEDNISIEDLSRPLKNIYDTITNVDYITNKISNSFNFKNGVYSDSFYLNPSTDVVTVTVNSQRKHYLRLTPGVGFLNGKNVSSYPTNSIAERQIAKILDLLIDDSVTEEVKINYYSNTDKFDLLLRRRNNNNVITDSTFSYGIHGDSMTGFDTGIELLANFFNNGSISSILRDYPKYNAILNNLHYIQLEPTIELTGGDSIYVGFDENFNLIGDTYSVFFPFYHVKTSIVSSRIKVTDLEDLRTNLIGDSIDNELIKYGEFTNDQNPTFDTGVVLIGSGGIVRTAFPFGNYNNIGAFIYSNQGRVVKLFFSQNNNTRNFHGMEAGNTYKISLRTSLNSFSNNISLNFYEYFVGDTEITTVRPRNIGSRRWQELIIIKTISYDAVGANFSFDFDRLPGDSTFIDDVSVKKISEDVIGDGNNPINTIRNITGDTFSINNIRADGDSEITFSNKIIGDSLEFNTIKANRFINGLTGDTLNIDTLLVDNIKNDGDINLLNKIVGDTVTFNTVSVENLLGSVSITAKDRRDAIMNVMGVYNIGINDEGKVINVDTTSIASTINLPDFGSGEVGYMVYIRKKFQQNLVTIIPHGTDTIDGETSRVLTYINEAVKVKWTGTEWVIISFYIDFPIPISKGGTGATTIEEFKTNLGGILTESEGDSKYALSSHTHSEYITSIPDEYLTQTEGDSLYYRKNTVDTAITNAKNSILGGAPSNLNTLDKIAASINDNPTFGDSINNKLSQRFSKQQGDSKYRNIILYEGNRTLPNNGDSIIVPLLDDLEKFRWLEFIYSHGDNYYNNKIKKSDLELTDYTAIGEENLLTINNANNRLIKINDNNSALTNLTVENYENITNYKNRLFTILNNEKFLYEIITEDGQKIKQESLNEEGLGDTNFSAFEEHNGVLYAINNSDNFLYTVDSINNRNQTIEKLTIEDTSNWSSFEIYEDEVYGISGNILYKINILGNLGWSIKRVHATNRLHNSYLKALFVQQNELYAIDGRNRHLHKINTNLGTSARVGTSTLASSGDTIYSVTSAVEQGSRGDTVLLSTQNSFYTLNVTNGTTTFLNSLTDGMYIKTNTFGDSNTTYGIKNGDSILYTVNISNGNISRVPGTNTIGRGCNGILLIDDVFYCFNNNSFFTFNNTGTEGSLAGKLHKEITNTLGTGDWRCLASDGDSILYTIDNTSRKLSTINLSTGRSTKKTNVLDQGNWEGLSFLGDTLYGFNNTNRILYKINKSTGAGSQVLLRGTSTQNFTVPSGNYRGLSGHGSNNFMYAINSTNNSLYRLTTTGYTRIGDSGSLGAGSWQAMASNGDTMYARRNNKLCRINLTNGTVIEALPNDLGNNIQALSFHGGVLYGISNTSQQLYTIDLSTGLSSLVSGSRQENLGENLYSMKYINNRYYYTDFYNRNFYRSTGDTIGPIERVGNINSLSVENLYLAYINNNLFGLNRQTWYNINISTGVSTFSKTDSLLTSVTLTNNNYIISTGQIGIGVDDGNSKLYKNLRLVNNLPVYDRETNFPGNFFNNFYRNAPIGMAGPFNNLLYFFNRGGTNHNTAIINTFNITTFAKNTFTNTDRTKSYFTSGNNDLLLTSVKIGSSPLVRGSFVYRFNTSDIWNPTLLTFGGSTTNTLNSGDWEAMASDGTNIYGINLNDKKLYTVSTVGRSTVVNDNNTLGTDFNGHCLGKIGDTLFTISENTVFQINKTNGTASQLQISSGINQPFRLPSGDYKAFGTFRNNLYIINNNDNSFNRINLLNASFIETVTIGEENWKDITTQNNGRNIVLLGNKIIYKYTNNSSLKKEKYEKITINKSKFNSLVSYKEKLYSQEKYTRVFYEIKQNKKIKTNYQNKNIEIYGLATNGDSLFAIGDSTFTGDSKWFYYINLDNNITKPLFAMNNHNELAFYRNKFYTILINFNRVQEINLNTGNFINSFFHIIK